MINVEVKENVEAICPDYPGEDGGPRPWGFWATLGFCFIIGIACVVVQIIVAAAFAVATLAQNSRLDVGQFGESLLTNGLFLSVATCSAAPLTIGLIVLFAGLRRGISVGRYLCLRRVGLKRLLFWCLAVIVLVAVSDSLTHLMGRSIVPEEALKTYRTARFEPLLWVTLVLVAPVLEELFFRGFMFRGIEASRLGGAGAIFITSLLWAVLHMQYDLYGITSIFLGGLLLGFARLRSKSIYPPLIMHMLQNIIATVEIVICLQMAPRPA